MSQVLPLCGMQLYGHNGVPRLQGEVIARTLLLLQAGTKPRGRDFRISISAAGLACLFFWTKA